MERGGKMSALSASGLLVKWQFPATNVKKGGLFTFTFVLLDASILVISTDTITVISSNHVGISILLLGQFQYI